MYNNGSGRSRTSQLTGFQDVKAEALQEGEMNLHISTDFGLLTFNAHLPQAYDFPSASLSIYLADPFVSVELENNLPQVIES